MTNKNNFGLLIVLICLVLLITNSDFIAALRILREGE